MTAAPVKVAPAWLAAPALKRLFAALGAPTVDVRCVGGCVRDAVMGRDKAVPEIDIATPEEPAQVSKRLEGAGIKVVPTGLDHGTVMAVIEGRGYEITSLRRDTACDGRHAAVEYTTDWREDARRRDFTMNAMSMALDGVVHDGHGGVADARAGRVRFVGEPADRIQEDYLRILRLFRFAALYGQLPVDAATLAACDKHRDGLARLSAERVHDELAKLLAASDPVSAVRQMLACGVLEAVIPGHGDVDALARLIAFEKELPSDCAANVIAGVWVRRLAVLNADVDAVAARLKLSNDERVRLTLALSSPISPNISDLDLRRGLFHDGAMTMLDRALVSAAKANHGLRAEIFAAICTWRHRPLPIGGNDVMALGVAAGPEVGRILGLMTEWWIGRAFTSTQAEALDELRRIAAE